MVFLHESNVTVEKITHFEQSFEPNIKNSKNDLMVVSHDPKLVSFLLSMKHKSSIFSIVKELPLCLSYHNNCFLPRNRFHKNKYLYLLFITLVNVPYFTSGDLVDYQCPWALQSVRSYGGSNIYRYFRASKK